MRDDRGSVSPWAFFPPVLLAVLIGNVGADLVAQVWQDEAPPATSTVAAEVHDAAPESAPSSPDVPLATPEPVVQPVAAATPAAPRRKLPAGCVVFRVLRLRARPVRARAVSGALWPCAARTAGSSR